MVIFFIPFTFKGKGYLLRVRVRSTRPTVGWLAQRFVMGRKVVNAASGVAMVRELEAVSDSMEDLVSEVHARLQYSALIYLCLQKQKSGSWYLRWRVVGPKNNRPYIDLLSQEGRVKIAIIPPVFQSYIFKVEKCAIGLNLKHAGILSSIRREQLRQSKLAQLSKLQFELGIESA